MIYKFLILTLTIVIAAVTSVSVYSPKSSPPTWPLQFEQTFTETFSYPLLGSSTTTGKFFYDYSNKRYRIDRANGKWDRFCGPIYPFSNTSCTQIVVQGKRFIYYPEKKYCCYCCGSENGCGVLKPQWLEGAEFQGIETKNGVDLEKWDKKGLQHNYYYCTNDNRRIMQRIIQEPIDDQEFDVDSYVGEIKDASVFDLPDYCDQNKTCPLLSTCTLSRNSR